MVAIVATMPLFFPTDGAYEMFDVTTAEAIEKTILELLYCCQASIDDLSDTAIVDLVFDMDRFLVLIGKGSIKMGDASNITRSIYRSLGGQ